MTTKEQLREEIRTIKEIYISAKENFLYSRYLYNPETSDELDFVQNNVHIRFIRYSLMKLSLIELSKLYSKKGGDKFRLQLLLDRLKRDGHYGAFNLELTVLQDWEKRLLTNNLQIDSLLTLRDKVFAHTDKDKEKFEHIKLTFKQIEELLDLTSDIIKEVYRIVFDSGIDLKATFFERNEINILKILALKKKERIDDILSFIHRKP